MDKLRLSVVLARALICAAWADDAIDPGEREFLDSFLRNIDGISETESKGLQALLDHRPLQSDILLTFKELREVAAIKEDREYILETVHGIFQSDGNFCDKEASFLQTLEKLLNADNENFYQEMSKVLESLKF
ncbi:TerB family tellurite resistance protein [Rubellicoccus peritrichatus]|uniref:TerB family tellurite resistance protein n=1 Tax=Rubellicoccus peritrichatus TaxID=3080537 RepID=A0AAQ3L7N0_9BACT|nr:TerB family tellurite resistance protein [Puniceicoccus sp. CR14]WOO40581.1 TerB family tellurite resistance protein [Puniceicoccus sp. CR14]